MSRNLCLIALSAAVAGFTAAPACGQSNFSTAAAANGHYGYTSATTGQNPWHTPHGSLTSSDRHGVASTYNLTNAPMADESYLPPSTYEIRKNCGSCRNGLYAGVEAVLVKPYYEDEIDTVRTIVIEPGEIIDMEIQLDPDYDETVSPRVFVGYRWCNGLGIRARYWVYDQNSNPLTAVDDFGQVLLTETLASDLYVAALDLEATKLLYGDQFQVEFSGGIRYGKVETNGHMILETELVGGGGFSQSTFGNTDFEGIGPTASLEGRHVICNSRFSLVGNLRASVLFGETRFLRGMQTSEMEPGQNPPERNQGSDDVVPVLESQVGLEYSHALHRGCLCARVLMEAQWWGAATAGGGFAAELDEQIARDQFTTDRDLGFFGVTASLIYQW